LDIAIVKLIAPAIFELIDPAQRARPGSPIDESIAYFNERFYGVAATDRRFFLLLLELEKAFDRLTLIATLLRGFGASACICPPEWAINVICALFYNIIALSDPFGLLHKRKAQNFDDS
jgi:hypothetical protein